MGMITPKTGAVRLASLETSMVEVNLIIQDSYAEKAEGREFESDRVHVRRTSHSGWRMLQRKDRAAGRQAKAMRARAAEAFRTGHGSSGAGSGCCQGPRGCCIHRYQ
eukprot:XP_001709747.1 Hypothetical protein GL50803_32049 [Giardia lamblia ATCC 50803]